VPCARCHVILPFLTCCHFMLPAAAILWVKAQNVPRLQITLTEQRAKARDCVPQRCYSRITKHRDSKSASIVYASLRACQGTERSKEDTPAKAFFDFSERLAGRRPPAVASSGGDRSHYRNLIVPVWDRDLNIL